MPRTQNAAPDAHTASIDVHFRHAPRVSGRSADTNGDCRSNAGIRSRANYRGVPCANTGPIDYAIRIPRVDDIAAGMRRRLHCYHYAS